MTHTKRSRRAHRLHRNDDVQQSKEDRKEDQKIAKIKEELRAAAAALKAQNNLMLGGINATRKAAETAADEGKKARADIFRSAEESRQRDAVTAEMLVGATSSLSTLSLKHDAAAVANLEGFNDIQNLIQGQFKSLENKLLRQCQTEPRPLRAPALQLDGSSAAAPPRRLFQNEDAEPNQVDAKVRDLETELRRAKLNHDREIEGIKKELKREKFRADDAQAELVRKTGNVQDVMDLVPTPTPLSLPTEESMAKHAETIRKGPTNAAKARREKQEATVAAMPRRSKRSAAKSNKN